MRKQIVAGNWKMNNSIDEAKKLTSEIVEILSNEKKSDVIVVLCPPYPYLGMTRRDVGDSQISVGAQNCHEADSGAFTGEVSTTMIKGMGAKYVIVGHSERREYFNEDDELLANKVSKVFDKGLTPIFCCGESLDIRESGEHIEYVKEQLTKGLFHLSGDEAKKLIIAYEPIWAIGTGKTASSEQAQEMHKELRIHLSGQYGENTAKEIPILYGGSVKPANAEELFGQPDVDGGLVGGASLNARDFADIVLAF